VDSRERGGQALLVRARPVLALLLLAACRTHPAPAPEAGSSVPPAGPYALVLGTAQDGGCPQIGCEAPCCQAARADPHRRARVASLLVVDPPSGRRFLIDATPDLAEQLELARGRPPSRHPAGARPPLFDAILLTHAHMGHYAGLLELGREAYGSRGTRVLASPRMAAFLRSNAPWSALFGPEGATLEELAPGRELELAPGLRVLPRAVPHREEFSDTLAFELRGPHRRLLYAPDTDGWERWDPPVEAWIAGVDFALLDATFFGAGELPGRDLSTIPHPFLADSLERFGALDPQERRKIRFTHLNHSNPALDPVGPAATAVRAAGLALAREGELLEL